MIAGAASSMAARAASRDGLIDAEAVDGVADGRVDRGADLVGLVGHAPDGGDDDAGHQGEQAEDDQAGGQGGLDPVPFEDSDRGFEDHGQHGRERQREHDLAHRGQRGDHDDRRRHEPHEAPRPDSELGNPAQQRRAPAPGSASRPLAPVAVRSLGPDACQPRSAVGPSTPESRRVDLAVGPRTVYLRVMRLRQPPGAARPPPCEASLRRSLSPVHHRGSSDDRAALLARMTGSSGDPDAYDGSSSVAVDGAGPVGGCCRGSAGRPGSRR